MMFFGDAKKVVEVMRQRSKTAKPLFIIAAREI
jgi:hypothetical protein